MPSYSIINVFHLESGTTVLACDGDANPHRYAGCLGKLTSPKEFRQTIKLIGKMHLSRQDPANKLIALETMDNVQLSPSEAQSGLWKLTIEES